MNDSLSEWHNGKAIAWGNLSYDDYNNKWYGVVYIPVGLSEQQLDSINSVFHLQEENKSILSKKELTTDEFFETLINHKEITSHLEIIGNHEHLFYGFPKTVIPTLSKKLEAENDWKKLIELESYTDLIDNLNETFKNSTLKRIEKAKKNFP